MTSSSTRRSPSLWARAAAPITRLWGRLTEAPPSVTDPQKRQRIRLNSILCLAGVACGFTGLTISHIGAAQDLNVTTDPIFLVMMATLSLVLVAYFLGRSEKTLTLAGVLLVAIVLGGNLVANSLDPADHPQLTIYIVVGDIFASLLLSPAGTRMTLIATVSLLMLYPLLIPQISIYTSLRSLGPIFVVSVMLAIGVTVRGRDLRTIEQQARQLAEAKQEAESANRLKGVFLGMISHELRTPLNNILGYADQMLMGVTGEMQPATATAAERIHRNGEQLNRMINDLLMLSRLEGGRLAIIQRPFVPADLLAEADRTFREPTEDKGLRFTTTLDTALPAVIVGDYQRITQIVINLASNALKFTDRGEIAIHVRRPSPSEWSVVVRDTGIGIPPEAAGRIFERFYQVDSSSRRSYGGAGLGLAIARELAILMGGNINLHTEVNAGSTFTLTLPLTLDETE